jgi:tetratricopeptide (TPR) repeat protein
MGRRIGPYRLLEQIGAGGMGAVFRAVREDQFRKEVAIKMIGAGFLHPDLRRRFVEERQILAALEHPHIARLLDGGATEDGQPYMVLECVTGTPITEYCRDLPLRAKLDLFQMVCLAVHYAHQHLVVHRDIKPANILVTPDGTPRLLDFGIAKILDPMASGAAATRGAPQLLTPEYASPEQLRGAALTTATDVYSLGVVLCELLSGSRPVIEAGATVRDWNAPEDLDAIVKKALRDEPGERYGSAREFAEDIARFLAGQTVLARGGSVWYSIHKWIARRKLVSALAASAAVLAAVGVAGIAWEAHVAELQRARAQKRFAELHDLAHSLIFELHDGIARMPGSTEVRKLLVARALRYLDSLARDAVGDTGLQVELASAYRRVGDAQGRWNQSNLGDTAGAMASYSKGLAAAEAALAASPGRDDALVEAGWLHQGIGEIYQQRREAVPARREMEQALTIFRSRKAGPTTRSELASALLLSSSAMRLQDPAAAFGNLDQSRALYEEELRDHPGDTIAMSNVSLACRYLALYGDRASALRKLDRARELDERRVAADPMNAGARADLSIDLSELGQHYVESGADSNAAIALGYFRRSLELRETLAAADPKDVMAQARVAFMHLSIARAFFLAGKDRDGVQSARRSIAISEQLVTANPANRSLRAWIAEAYLRIGRAERKRGASGPACGAFRSGARTADGLPTTGTDSWLIDVKNQLAAGLTACNGRAMRF